MFVASMLPSAFSWADYSNNRQHVLTVVNYLRKLIANRCP